MAFKLFNGTLKGNRKFAFAILALIFSFVLALVGKITGDNWVWVVGALMALFGGANVFEHFAKVRGGEG